MLRSVHELASDFILVYKHGGFKDKRISLRNEILALYFSAQVVREEQQGVAYNDATDYKAAHQWFNDLRSAVGQNMDGEFESEARTAARFMNTRPKTATTPLT